MTVSQLILGGAIILWSFVVGLAVIAFGQVMLAIREIAINTRKGDEKTPHYEVLLIAAKINNLLGWILIVAGLALGVYTMIKGLPFSLPTVSTTIPTTL
jgi:hypothetical protein